MSTTLSVAQGDGYPQRIEVAQQRTLFDLLFGPRQVTPPPATTRQTPTRRTTSPTPQRAIVAAAPVVEKEQGATRLAVFGDSLAIDLAKAFERAFADDPNLLILSKGVGSSGFVRDDFYDWGNALKEEISADSFDIAVIIIGVNDKQAIGRVRPLSDEWKVLYLERLNSFLDQLRAANKPVIWIGLPPMRANSYSNSVSEISSLHRLASISAGVEFVDIYERFVDENGRYSSRGPNLNGEDALMRKGDGIHFSSAGSDKVVFFAQQALRLFYRGGSLNLNISDPLEGTDAVAMVRLPFQGNGHFRLLEVAGAVIALSSEPARAAELVVREQAAHSDPFDTDQLMLAPIGRADDFGVGVDRAGDETVGPEVSTTDVSEN
ncbi:MAG: hypothetical protein L3J13_05575 [Devosiaceae bacterium]|nr:hypothetical protein [Devosiaceae bacterium]